MSSNKSSGKGRTTTGILAALVMSAILCGAYAVLVKNGKCTQENADIVISIAIAISSALGGALANAGRVQKRLIGGAVTGAGYAAILAAVPLAAYPTEVDWIKIFEIIIISIVCGAIGSTVNLCKGNKKFRKDSKIKR